MEVGILILIKLCYICQKRHGAPIQCSTKNCFVAFHPTCARAAKLHMKMRGQDISDSSLFRAYCDKHSPKEYKDKVNTDHFLEKAQYELSQDTSIPQYDEDDDSELRDPKMLTKPSRKQVSLTNPIIPQYILARIVAEQVEIMPKKRTDLIIHIARYWSLKKQSLGGATLLKRLHLEVILF
jgi:NuA3 HAT complex component NTO1